MLACVYLCRCDVKDFYASLHPACIRDISFPGREIPLGQQLGVAHRKLAIRFVGSIDGGISGLV
jgi:hypothetical protein